MYIGLLYTEVLGKVDDGVVRFLSKFLHNKEYVRIIESHQGAGCPVLTYTEGGK